MELRIRTAFEADIPAIAKVNVGSWLQTYPGIMPQSRLDSLSEVRCTQNWHRAFREDRQIIIVAEVDGAVEGFAAGGQNRFEEGCSTGVANACEAELAAMYLLAAYHKRGIGKALFEEFCRRVQNRGWKDMAVWVAAANASRLFYERMGCEKVDSRDLTVLGEAVPLLGYRKLITE